MYEPKQGPRRLRCDFPEGEAQRPEEGERFLKVVDFIWQPDGETWLVEIKDPLQAREDHRQAAVQTTRSGLSTGALVDEHLLPKLFGTYVWLFRQGGLRPVPHRYAVLIALESLDTPLRIAALDRIQRAVDAVGPTDRASGMAPVAEVHDLTSWNSREGSPQIVREG